MLIRNKLTLAIITASLTTQIHALELGEFNGTSFSIGGYVSHPG